MGYVADPKRMLSTGHSMVLVAILVVVALILVNALVRGGRIRRRQRPAQPHPAARRGRQSARRLAVADPRVAGGARPLHRRLPDRHHALEPRPRCVRAGDARGLADAVLRGARRAAGTRRPVHVHGRRAADADRRRRSSSPSSCRSRSRSSTRRRHRSTP